MKDIFVAFFEASKERLKNPLLSSFIIFWFVFNWRPFLYIFLSNENFRVKILHVDAQYSDCCNNLIFPLLIALVYTLGFPHFMAKLDIVINKGIEKRKGEKQKVEIKKIQRVKDRFEEETKMELAESGVKDIKILKDTLNSLAIQINTLKSENKSLDLNLEKAYARAQVRDKYEEYFLKFTSKNEEINPLIEHFPDVSKYQRHEYSDMNETIIDEYLKLGWINKRSTEQGSSYSITPWATFLWLQYIGKNN